MRLSQAVHPSQVVRSTHSEDNQLYYVTVLLAGVFIQKNRTSFFHLFQGQSLASF